jgi:hypothetical protein
VVFAHIDRGGSATIDSATYGGVAMVAGTAFTSSSAGWDGRLFWLAGAASGNNNVVVTISTSGAKVGMIGVAYSGVDGTTPVEDETTAATSTTNQTWTVDSASGDVVIALSAHFNNAATLTGGAGTTVRVNQASGSYMLNALEKAGAASVTINGTMSTSHEWWGTAVNLVAAGGGAVSTSGLLTLGVG